MTSPGLKSLLACALGLALIPVARTAAGEHPTTGPGDDLFGAPRVIALSFDITPSELDAMKKGSHQYGRCTLREGGASYSDVGIRYKGNPAKEAASGKPDFNLELNQFVSGQKFHGLKRLLLLAGRNDPSYLSAPIGLELFRKAGVPAARSGFATVQINGRPLGLYVLVEGVDRDFIERHFDKSSGNLYDEGPHTDVDGKLEKYGGKNDTDQSDVDALAAAARQNDSGRRWEQLQRLLDVDRFVTFAALEVFLWLNDSYTMKARKFRLYHDPSTDRMVFFPKNVEEVLHKTDGALFPEWKGVVARAILTCPEGEKRYRAAMAKLLGSVINPEEVQARGRELAAAIRPTIAGENPEAALKFDAAVTHFFEAVAQRTAFVARQLKAAQSN
jgi:hypothetical protein